MQAGISGALKNTMLLSAGAAAGVLSVFPGQERLLLALLLVMAAGSLAVRNPRQVVVLMLIFLPLMGFIRRVLISFAGLPAFDPLILIVPAVAFILCAAAVWKFPGIFDSLVSRLAGALIVIILYQTVNPLQGNLPVGFAGAIFFVTPLFWFFVGKRYGDKEAFAGVEKILVAMGLACGVYGLWQNFMGFFPFEEAWVEAVRSKYVTLVAYGKTRAFSTFTSSQEFANFMAVTLAVCCSKLIFRERFKSFYLVPGAIAAACIVYSGIRGIVVMLALSAAALALFRNYRQPLKVLISIAAIVLVLFVFISAITSIRFSEENAPIINHLAGGLTDPMNPGKSSLMHHLDSLERGVRIGTSSPLGYGAGSTNLGGAKFGGISISAEVDLVDVLMASGWAGGIVYFAIVAALTIQAIRLNILFPGSRQYFVALWLLLLTGGQWLNGGNYFLTCLIWLLAGWLDNRYREAFRTGSGERGGGAG